jgi:hypothetical protein
LDDFFGDLRLLDFLGDLRFLEDLRLPERFFDFLHNFLPESLCSIHACLRASLRDNPSADNCLANFITADRFLQLGILTNFINT